MGRVILQTQQTAEATHLAAAVLEIERRLRGCALSAQWRQPVCATDGTVQVSAAAAPPLRRSRPAQTLNVRRQVHNLINSPPVSGAWKEGRDLSVHGVMFRIETGLLEVSHVAK